jgi:hypothetical protein
MSLPRDKILLGILGAIGSGKSTVSDILKDNGAEVFAFADPLKDIAAILGFSRDSLYGTQVQKAAIDPYWGVSAREFLQKFGSEICREVLPQKIPNMRLNYSIWLQLAQKRIDNSMSEFIVLSDCRFNDEAAMIKRNGGKLIRIIRPEVETKKIEFGEHKSEYDIRYIIPDIVIINDGDLDQLKRKTMIVYNTLYSNRGERENLGLYSTGAELIRNNLGILRGDMSFCGLLGDYQSRYPFSMII